MLRTSKPVHGCIQTLLLALAVVIAGVAISKAAGNGQPRSIVYEGYLEEDGEPASRALNIQFEIWDENGRLWGSANKPVFPVEGRFSVVLGDQSDDEPLEAVWEARGTHLFVRLTVEGERLQGQQEIFPAAMAVRGVPGEVLRANRVESERGIATHGFAADQGYPSGLTGGIHTRDVYAEGSIAVGQQGQAASEFSQAGDGRLARNLTVGGNVTVSGNLSVSGQTTIHWSNHQCNTTSDEQTVNCAIGTHQVCTLQGITVGQDNRVGALESQGCWFNWNKQAWTLVASRGSNPTANVTCRAVCF